MRWFRRLVWLSFILWPLLLAGKEAVTPGHVVVLEISGPIGPATSEYVHRGLKRAQDTSAALVILRMDTPGGLDTAMRTIIRDILASPVPVATFVSPSGARATSAGAYILIASHIAAMAPGTTVGAATPVRIGGVPDPGSEPPRDEQAKDKAKKEEDKPAKPKPGMEEKILSEAIAYIRGLAQMRGRNVEWAEKAVREAASLSSEEAVKINVADLLASDVPDLLKRLDGRRIKIDDRQVVLRTEGLIVQVIEPDWRNRLLSVITDPNIAYILMLLGIYGLFFELWNPGYVLPGVVGAICLLLALYAFQVLPINYAGLGLILLGIVFMVAEALTPAFGVLGFGGIIAFVVGSIILMDTDVEGYAIAWPLIVTVAITSALFFIGVAYVALRARRRQVVSGQEEMIGLVGEVLESSRDGSARVRVHSEEWLARSDKPLKRGQKIRIVGMEGLKLIVEPFNREGN